MPWVSVGEARPTHFRPCAILAVLLLSTCARSAQAGGALLPDAVHVATIELRAAPVEGAVGEELEGFRELAASVSIQATIRAVLDARLAPAATPAAGESAAYTIRGWVSVPTALPSDLPLADLSRREGDLVRACLLLVDARGSELARGGARLSWRSVHWTTGGRRFRQARSAETVLLDATERGVTEAARALAKDFASSAHGRAVPGCDSGPSS
jgi:hypothetical protein